MTTDSSADASTSSDTDQDGTSDTDTTDWKAEAEKWRTQSRKHEDRAKANAQAAKDLEALKQQHMTDSERAVAEAKAAGRSEALAEMGGKLVEAEFRVIAKGRLDDKALDALMAALDRGPFVNDDGSPNRQAIEAFVDGIAPKQQGDQQPGIAAPLDLGQGARGGDALALNSNPLLNDLKAHLGIR